MRIRTIGDFITADIKALFTILTVSRAFLTDEYLKCYRNALDLIIYYKKRKQAIKGGFYVISFRH